MTGPAARARVLFFWDYDTQWGVDADAARGIRGADGRGWLEFRGAERLLELHAEYAVPACFAVVAAAARPGARPYHDPDQIRRFHAAGHEVASHALYHEWLPALGPAALERVVRESRSAIEDCVGAPCVSFVPPYNQPFDYLPRASISLAERRQAGPERTDLRRLCEALAEAGYRFCRVAYRSAFRRTLDRVRPGRGDDPVRAEPIAGVTCLRLNTPGGFNGPAHRVLARAAGRGGHVIFYGHPHSLNAGNTQDERWLIPLLREVARERAAGRLEVMLPRELVGEEAPCGSAW